MNVYRLDPVDSGHASWRYSNEKDSVWACAHDTRAARELVASKADVAAPEANAPSPWTDEVVTSCVLDPTITLMRAGTVVRQDGSLVQKGSQETVD